MSSTLEPGHGSDPASATARRLRLTPASLIEPQPVVWAWSDEGEGRIPSGALSLAAGREGTGKSSFGMYLAARVTIGDLPGNLFGKPRDVFYVAIEDSWKHTLVPRLMAAGADLDRVYRIEAMRCDDTEVTLSLPLDNALLAEAIREFDAALVVIDPLMSVMGESIDTHKNREVRKALDPLAAMAETTGAVILGIAHFGKGTGTDAASLISGSGAFKDVPRAIFGFVRDTHERGQQRVMSQVKNSLGRDDLPSLTYEIVTATVPTSSGDAVTARFAFTGTSDRTVEEILRDKGQPDEYASEAAQFVAEYLRDRGGCAGAADIKKAGITAGFNDSALNRAKKSLKIKPVKSGMNGGWAWALPDTLPEAVTKTSKAPPLGKPTPSTSSVTPSTPVPPSDAPKARAHHADGRCPHGFDIASGHVAYCPECNEALPFDAHPEAALVR